MSGAVVPLDAGQLSREEARSLTDEVRLDAERLWRKLVELYEGGAHRALKYGSWGAYFKAEFGGSRTRAYHLLDAGRVAREIESPIGDSPVPNESQARELAPLRHDPETLKEAWTEVVETYEKPTAADVRAVVEKKVGPMSRKAAINAEASKRKLYAALSTISGTCLGLDGFPHERALALATPDDVAAWERLIGDSISALNKLRRSIREGS